MSLHRILPIALCFPLLSPQRGSKSDTFAKKIIHKDSGYFTHKHFRLKFEFIHFEWVHKQFMGAGERYLLKMYENRSCIGEFWARKVQGDCECQDLISNLQSKYPKFIDALGVSMDKSLLDRFYQNKGLGTRGYEILFESIYGIQNPKRPIIFLSDSCNYGETSDQAFYAWRSLSKKYPVEYSSELDENRVVLGFS
jgi:hypothetical protein